jgi:hypothetical protein
MNPRLFRPALRLLAGSAFLISSLAHAQYAWIDAKGVHHYSDQPPPPSAPAVRMLKAPRGASIASADGAPTVATPASAPKAPPTLAEREADYRKRAQERAKQEQKDALEAQHKAAQAENCEAARRYQAQLQSDIRVADTGADGERTFISDEERARRLAKTNTVLQGCR